MRNSNPHRVSSAMSRVHVAHLTRDAERPREAQATHTRADTRSTTPLALALPRRVRRAARAARRTHPR